MQSLLPFPFPSPFLSGRHLTGAEEHCLAQKSAETYKAQLERDAAAIMAWSASSATSAPKRATELHMFFTVRVRNSDETSGPPCSIAAIVGSLERNTSTVCQIVERFDVSMSMPVPSEWEPRIAYEAVASSAALLHQNVPTPEQGLKAFFDFLTRWEKACDKLTLVSDSLVEDARHLSYWIRRGLGVAKPITQVFSSGSFVERTVTLPCDVVLSKRAESGRTGYDLRGRKSLEAALAKNGFASKLTEPSKRVLFVFCQTCIAIHLDPVPDSADKLVARYDEKGVESLLRECGAISAKLPSSVILASTAAAAIPDIKTPLAVLPQRFRVPLFISPTTTRPATVASPSLRTVDEEGFAIPDPRPPKQPLKKS